MNRRTLSGFTLLELLVTIVVAGVILGIGVPNLMEFQRNNAMAGASNELVTAVLAARSEAVKRGVPVTLCASADPLADPPACAPDGAGTDGGFIVWEDVDGDIAVDVGEDVIRRVEPPGGAIDVFMDGGYIAYGTNGFTRTDVGVDDPLGWLLYCDDRGRRVGAGGRSTARLVQVQLTGRAEVLSDADLIADRITNIAAIDFDCP